MKTEKEKTLELDSNTLKDESSNQDHTAEPPQQPQAIDKEFFSYDDGILRFQLGSSCMPIDNLISLGFGVMQHNNKNKLSKSRRYIQ